MMAYFGTCEAPSNKVDKTSAINMGITAHDCSVKQPVTITAPYLILDAAVFDTSVNYAQIPDYSRYYYVTSVDVLPGNRVGVQCAVDPLMSFADAIKALTLNIERGPDYAERSKLVTDANVTTLAKMQTQRINFAGSELSAAAGDGRHFVLITA